MTLVLVVAELVGCGVEHLGFGVQFDVHLGRGPGRTFDASSKLRTSSPHYLVPLKSKSRIRVSVSGRLL